MVEEEIAVEETGPETDEDVPGLDPALEKQRSEEFSRAVAALDSRGQRIVGQMLAGARTTEVAERLSAGDVEVLSEGIITATKRDAAGTSMVKQGEAMRAALRLAGIDETFLASVLFEGLKARKHVVSKGNVRRVPDYAIRIRYLELAHRLRGDLIKENGTTGDVSYEERIRTIMRRASSDD